MDENLQEVFETLQVKIPVLGKFVGHPILVFYFKTIP